MSEGRGELEREAAVFTRALIGTAAPAYVVGQYQRGHKLLPLAPGDRFDRLLLALARATPVMTRIADAYACRLARRAVLRRKLTLLLALLESSEPGTAAFLPARASFGAALLRLAGAGAAAAGYTLAGVLLLGPLHLFSRIVGAR